MDVRRHTSALRDDVVPPGDVRAQGSSVRRPSLHHPPNCAPSRGWSRPQFAVQALGPSHLMTISSYVKIWFYLDHAARPGCRPVSRREPSQHFLRSRLTRAHPLRILICNKHIATAT